MELCSLSVKRVVIGNNSVLISGIRGKFLKFHLILGVKLKLLLRNYPFSVVKHRERLALAERYQVKLVCKRDLKAYLGEIHDLVANSHRGQLISSVYTRLDGFVSIYYNVLYLSAVDIFYRVYRIFNNTLGVSDVLLKNYILHIRAVLKHIGRIFLAVEGKGNYLKVVGVVKVNGYIDILILSGVIYLFFTANDLKAILSFLLKLPVFYRHIFLSAVMVARYFSVTQHLSAVIAAVSERYAILLVYLDTL